MTEQVVELVPGESKQVFFEAVPHEARTYRVSVNGLTGSFVAIAPAGLALSLTNPKNSTAFRWVVQLYDVATHQWQASPLLNLADPYTFTPTSGTYILLVEEHYLSGGLQTSMMYGPYLLTNAPMSGSYVWDARAERLDGVSSINMPKVSNSCVIGGTLTGIQWTQDRGGELQILVDESLPSSGQNWGKYFIGTTITVYSNYPFEVVVTPYYWYGVPIISTGRRVKAWAKMTMGQYLYQWEADKVTYYPDYPASAYIFNVSGDIISGYTITGNVSSFSVVIWYPDGHYVPHPEGGGTFYRDYSEKFIGPIQNWHPPATERVECWCHPNPDASFPMNAKSAIIANWVKVRSF